MPALRRNLVLLPLVCAVCGCASWSQSARTRYGPRGPADTVRPSAPAANPVPLQDAPYIPDPNAAAPRIELGTASRLPPTTYSRITGTTPNAPIVTTPVVTPRWNSDYESTRRRHIQTAGVGAGDSRVLVTANLNGNDARSVELLDRIAARLMSPSETPDDRRIVLVRNPNPDGLAESISVNARGVDLNRNFPSARFTASPTQQTGSGPASEVETRVMLRLLGENSPRRVVHIRSGDGRTPLVRANAAGIELLRELQDDFGVAIEQFDGEYRAGSLEEFAATRLKAEVFVIELPAGSRAQDHLDLALATIRGGRWASMRTSSPDDPVLPETPEHLPPAPIASQPAQPRSPAALTGRVEPLGPDGSRGYVELLPPPPHFANEDSASAARFYELPPP